MVQIRSQNSPLGVEYNEQSAQEPTPREPNTAHPVRIHFTDPSRSGESSRQEPIIGIPSADGEPIQHSRSPSPTRSTGPQRCSTSKAARIRQAEYEAAERIAAIEIRRLQLQANLVKKKLEVDIAWLKAYEQDKTRGTSETSIANVHVEDRLRHTDHDQREPTYDSPPARATRTNRAATLATAMNMFCMNNSEIKPEQCRQYRAATPAVTTCMNNSEHKLEQRRPNYAVVPALNNGEPKLEQCRPYQAVTPATTIGMNSNEPKPERHRTYHAATPFVTIWPNNTEPKPERLYDDLRVKWPAKNYLRTEHNGQEKIHEMLRLNEDAPTVTLNQNEPRDLRSTRAASQTQGKNRNANVLTYASLIQAETSTESVPKVECAGQIQINQDEINDQQSEDQDLDVGPQPAG